VENAQDRRRIAPIRVLLADDQPLYLETLELLLAIEDDIEIVSYLSKAAHGSAIIAELTRHAPAPPPLSERTAA
jgi:hypothetical protein